MTADDGDRVLPADYAARRLDRALADWLVAEGRAVSVREVRRALSEGQIRVDGRRRAPGDRARGGERVDLGAFVARAETEVAPEPALVSEVAILYEDDHRLVLDKPSGWPCQPLRPGEQGTLLAAAIAIAPSVASAGPPLEGGLSHRLDIGTSGVVVFAKDPAERARLRRAFDTHAVRKIYGALVCGALPDEAFVDAPLAGAGDRVRVVEPGAPGAQPAASKIRVVERFDDAMAWVEVRTHTGRRHQVRAHLAHLGAPIAGDALYGPVQDPALDRLGLHALEVRLDDGDTYRAPPSGALAARLAALGGRA